MGNEIVITCPPADDVFLFAAPPETTHKSHMQFLPCARPTDSLEIAPLTDMSVHMDETADSLHAFWSGDDAYYVCAVDQAGAEAWYRIQAEATSEAVATATEAAELSAQLASILPLATGCATFPVGSSGRTVYRVWRTRSADNQGQSRTKIRAVRAARSRRLPA